MRFQGKRAGSNVAIAGKRFLPLKLHNRVEARRAEFRFATIPMLNPFDNPDGLFYVLANEEGQYSLWPAPLHIPVGWKPLFGVRDRQQCLSFTAENWKQPASVNT